MIQHPTAPADLHTEGERITVSVLGRNKPVATALKSGLEVWCKVFSAPATISYQQLMSVPAFRDGVLAVLASERNS